MLERVHEIAREHAALRKKQLEVMWVQYTAGLDFGVVASTAAEHAFLRDKSNFAAVCDAREKDLNPEDRRRIEIMYHEFQEHHLSDRANKLRKEIDEVETVLSDVLNKNRVLFEGREIQLLEWSKLVTENTDRAVREKAYLARRNINRKLFDSGFLKLIDLRKEFAVASGAEDFVSYQLRKSELTPAVFEDWRTECGKRAIQYQETRRGLSQKHLGLESLKPWDVEFLKTKLCRFNKAPVEIADFMKPMSKVFSAFGFDIERLNITFDIFPRKNKSEWGFLFPMEIGRDTRVLANVDSRFSSYWVLLHETAHGVHFLGLDAEDHLMNAGVSGIVAEGFANFFGDLSYSKEFLREVFVPGSEAANRAGADVETIERSFRDVKRLGDLKNFSSMATAIFDQELYRTDLKSLDDIHELKWSLDREMLGAEPYADEPLWAHLIHHTTAPIYLHNYILGDVMCENMKEIFQRRTGSAASDCPLEFGTFWKEKVLAPSGRYSFLDLYERVCEEPLSISRYLDFCLRDQ
jgi:oligoendopeptidase F